MAKRVAAVAVVCLTGCLAVGTEQDSARVIEDDRILPVTDVAGSMAGVDGTPLSVTWGEGRFAGATFTLGEPLQVRVSADAGAAPIDPIVVVYGPRDAQGSWTARVGKIDANAGPIEQTPAIALEPGQYLVSVGEFERRAGTASIAVTRALALQTVEIRGWVFGRDMGADTQARQAWGEVCDAWHQTALGRLGAGAIEDEFSCGDPVDLDASSWTFLSSEPVLRARVGLAGAARSAGARVVTGLGNGAMGNALESWRTKCASLEDHLVALYGGRALGVSCGTPSDVDPSSGWYVYQSTATVTLAPAAGTAVEATELVFGAGNGSSLTAFQSLEDACDAWMEEQFARTGARIESLECGTPRDDDPSSGWYEMSATATARFIPGPGRESSASTIAAVRGSGNGSSRQALASWRTACKTRLDALITEMGDAFLGATCGVPSDTDPSSGWYLYESTPVVWLAR